MAQLGGIVESSENAIIGKSPNGTIISRNQSAERLFGYSADDLGFGSALEWQVRDFQDRTGIPCELSIDATIHPESIAPEQATAFFRIAQELLTNILRHAKASQIRITLQKKEKELFLEVHDNGVGYVERPHSSRGSLGLLGIQERAKALGGHFTIAGRFGGGTSAVVQIPSSIHPLSIKRETL